MSQVSVCWEVELGPQAQEGPLQLLQDGCLGNRAPGGFETLDRNPHATWCCFEHTLSQRWQCVLADSC